jgi:LysM repeat protein
VVLLLLAVAVYGVFGLGRASAGPDPVSDQKREVVVQPGDSLWSLAVRAMPQRDPRDAVAELRSRNHLSSSNLVVGQRLVVR